MIIAMGGYAYFYSANTLRSSLGSFEEFQSISKDMNAFESISSNVVGFDLQTEFTPGTEIALKKVSEQVLALMHSNRLSEDALDRLLEYKESLKNYKTNPQGKKRPERAFSDFKEVFDKGQNALRADYMKAQEKINSMSQNAQDVLKMFAGIFAALFFFQWIYISRRILSPLARISHYLGQIEQGIKVEGFVASSRKDEVGTIENCLTTYNEQTTLIREVENQLQVSRSEAEKASEIKGEFMERMSHELRTPLNAIIGYSEMILDSVQVGMDLNQLKQDLTKITNSGQNLLKMVDAVLELSDTDQSAELNLEDFNVRDQIQLILPSLEPVILKNHNKFNVLCPDPTIRMVSDPQKIMKILVNLISNASNFTDHGKILLSINKQEGLNGSEMCFRVSDTGCGINQEDLEKILAPFNQVDTSFTRKQDGLGLGLTLVHKLCTQLNGKLKMESILGRGTTVTIIVPLVPEGYVQENPDAISVGFDAS